MPAVKLQAVTNNAIARNIFRAITSSSISVNVGFLDLGNWTTRPRYPIPLFLSARSGAGTIPACRGRTDFAASSRTTGATADGSIRDAQRQIAGCQQAQNNEKFFSHFVFLLHARLMRSIVCRHNAAWTAKFNPFGFSCRASINASSKSISEAFGNTSSKPARRG